MELQSCYKSDFRNPRQVIEKWQAILANNKKLNFGNDGSICASACLNNQQTIESSSKQEEAVDPMVTNKNSCDSSCSSPMIIGARCQDNDEKLGKTTKSMDVKQPSNDDGRKLGEILSGPRCAGNNNTNNTDDGVGTSGMALVNVCGKVIFINFQLDHSIWRLSNAKQNIIHFFV